MTRWIVLVAAASLVACGGAEETQDGPPVPAADAGGDVAPDADVTCTAELVLCVVPGGARMCVDTYASAEHCGGCGVRCTSGETCSLGACR